MNNQNYELAFVFPGQGSQSVGMLGEMSESFPEIKQTFVEASDILGKDLWALSQQDNTRELNQTVNTQPVMLAAGISVWRSWCHRSTVRPSWVAGHSLGEYTALVCAEAIAFADAVKLVSERGRLMQEAVPEGSGAMAAILGLQDEQVVKLCQEAAENEIVAAVNFNAPGQVVIAGNATAVDRAIVAAKDLGAKRALPLPVSVPSHCTLMQSAAEKLHTNLQAIAIDVPKMTLIHNVDIATHSAAEVIRNTLKEQLYKPVRWVDSIKYMHDQGVQTFVECGPGKVLMGLNKRIVKTANHMAIYDQSTFDNVMEQFND